MNKTDNNIVDSTLSDKTKRHTSLLTHSHNKGLFTANGKRLITLIIAAIILIL